MIVVFGSINLDLVVALPRLPGPGETISGPDYQTFAGGKGGNQALAAGRAGADVQMVGAVGQDAFAELALANMRVAGVGLDHVRHLEGTTGLAFIGIDTAGENQIIVASGANTKVKASWLDGVLGQEDLLLMQGEVPTGEITAAIALAKTTGTLVVWNPAPVPAEQFASRALSVDMLIVNETEAQELAKHLGVPGDPHGFLNAIGNDDRHVVVTLGANGVVARAGGDTVVVTPPNVDVSDTTGAGDAFCGALAAAVSRGAPLERALAEGVSAGSLACTATGAQSSAPGYLDISALADTLKVM